jgi:hypothetical protein
MKYLFIVFFSTITIAGYAQFNDSICSRIERQFNDEKKETILYAPFLKKCSIVKVISKKETNYYISLEVEGEEENTNGTGAKLFYSNGQLTSFLFEPLTINPLGGGRYKYSALIKIEKQTLKIMQEYPIVKWNLYIYDGFQSSEDAEKMMKAVNCLLKMKQ